MRFAVTAEVDEVVVVPAVDDDHQVRLQLGDQPVQRLGLRLAQRLAAELPRPFAEVARRKVAVEVDAVGVAARVLRAAVGIEVLDDRQRDDLAGAGLRQERLRQLHRGDAAFAFVAVDAADPQHPPRSVTERALAQRPALHALAELARGRRIRRGRRHRGRHGRRCCHLVNRRLVLLPRR